MNEIETTDFNYGANTEFLDVILSFICTVCNDGCWLAGKKTLVLYHIYHVLYFHIKYCILSHYAMK